MHMVKIMQQVAEVQEAMEVVDFSQEEQVKEDHKQQEEMLER